MTHSIDYEKLLREIYLKYIPNEANYEETGKFSSLSHMDYGEMELTFHVFIAKVKVDKIVLTPEDMQIIDQIGEGLWNSNFYHRYSMSTKYWYDVIGKPPYDNASDKRRLIRFDGRYTPQIREYDRCTFKVIEHEPNWYITELPLAKDTLEQLAVDGEGRAKYELLPLLRRDLPADEYEVMM